MNRSESIDTTDSGMPRKNRLWNESKPLFQFSIRRLLLFTFGTCIVLGCFFKLPAILSWTYSRWEVGRQFDQRTFEEAQFTLRVTAFNERGSSIGMGAPGGYYRYEVKGASDWWWRRILMFRLPSPEPIPEDQFRCVTNTCAYFFHDNFFGLTMDAGASWSFRGGPDDPSIVDEKPVVHGFSRYACIDSVLIDPDGTGVMQVTEIDSDRNYLPSSLVTSDFGLTWREQ